MINNNLKKKFESLIVFLSIYSFILAPYAKASEFVVSENGTGSANEVVSQNTTETIVTQENTADVANNVDVNANTGGNTASGNTGGDTTIDTGDTQTDVTLDNQVNTSNVESTECCVGETNVLITGNGEGSKNSIDLTGSSQTDVYIDQFATITNNITGYINTGKNIANNNTGGSTSIETGDINVKTEITDARVNLGMVTASSGNGESVTAKISENGEGTINTISALFNNYVNSRITNISKVDNNVSWYLNTGGNEANGNTGGDVLIKTGDINLDILINNFINLGITHIDNCCGEEDIEDPDDIDDPGEESDPTDNRGGTSDNSSNFSSSNSSASLPAGAEASAGGAGILGLSDTSGGLTQAILFWAGLAFIAFGGKLVADATPALDIPSKNKN